MAINVEKIQKAIEDVTSLEVATLSNPDGGTLDLSAASSNADIFTAIRASLNQADLVAYTKYELDGDAVNYIKKGDDVKELIEGHATLVDAALATRKALFDTIYTAVKDII